MSPAQLSCDGSMKQKEDASSSSSSLGQEMASSLREIPPDSSRYPSRSQPKTPPHSGNPSVSPNKSVLKRKLQEGFEATPRIRCDNSHSTLIHDDRLKLTHEVKIPPKGQAAKGGSCPKCHKTFRDLHGLTFHVKEHNTNDTVCGICGKKLSSVSSLDRHMLTHTGFKPFKCKYCPQRFTTNGNMNRHMHTHELEMANKTPEEEKTPTVAPVASSKAPVAQKDEPTVSKEETKMCPEVPKGRVKSLQEKFERDIISSSVEGAKKVEKLPRDAQLPLKVENNNTFQNETKVVGFDDLNHMPFSSPKFGLVAKKACEETLRVPHSFEISFRCRLCSRFFPCANALRTHEMAHKSSRSTVCQDCQCHFGSPHLLDEHRMKHHPNLEESGRIGNAGLFMAAIGLHRRSAELSRLLMYGDGDIKRTSSSLGASSANLEASSSREDKLHTKRKVKDEDGPKRKVLKPVAEVAMPLLENKSDVQKDVAPEKSEPVLSCCSLPGTSRAECSHHESSNDFADISSIISNVASGSGPSSGVPSKAARPGSSGSETDTYSLRKFTSLKKKGFKSSHAKSKQRYSCPNCEYKTKEKSSLMRHSLTHDKERPFKCTLCGMTFTTKSNGERHAKTIHRLTKAELPSVIDYNLRASGSNKMQKMCKYCYKLFENNRALQHHLRSKNNECTMKPFICRECRHGFSTKNNCHRHIQNLHKDLLVHHAKTDVFIIVNKYLKNLARKNRQLSASNGESSNASNFKPLTSLAQQNLHRDSDRESSGSETSSYEAPSPSSLPLQQNMEQHSASSVAESYNCETSCSMATSPMPQQNLEQQSELSPSEASSSRASSPKSLEVQYSFSEDDRVKAAESLVSLSEGLDLSREIESVQQPVFEDAPLDLSVRAIDLTERRSPPQTPNHSAWHCSFDRSVGFALLVSSNTTNEEAIDYSAFATPLNLAKKPNNCLNTSLPCQNSSTPCPSNQGSVPSTSNSLSVPQLKTSRSEVLHECNYCDGKFTQKSNKDRHIRNFHPEHAKPRRNKNFPPTVQGKSYLRHASSTLSSATREALLSRVLQHTDGNKQSQFDSDHSMDLVIKEEPVPAEEGITSDLENVDLASVKSVIHTANSPKFMQYLTEEGGSFGRRDADQSAGGEPSRKKHKSNNDRALSCDFPTCTKTFNCRSSLKRHSVIHTGERAFECHICQKQFTTNSNMVRHVTNKHKVSLPRRQVRSPLGQTTTCSVDPNTSNGSTGSVSNDTQPTTVQYSWLSAFVPTNNLNGSLESTSVGPMSSSSSQPAWPTSSVDPNSSNGPTVAVLHTPSTVVQCTWSSTPTNNLNNSTEPTLPSLPGQTAWSTSSVDPKASSHGHRNENVPGEECVSPATRRQYPEPNRSPDLPETSQAAMPCNQSPAFECTFCRTTYNTEGDRWDHVKQLHPLEYGKMHGRHVNLPDIVSIWKKNGCAKMKR